ncbi:FecR family protein [Pedobacter sp. AW31-3R]|uniref:FecR family protein n=1 Tax=Pedobacter sp. AW31-3R TaxID=3445781 RepID=UPI003FA157D5
MKAKKRHYFTLRSKGSDYTKKIQEIFSDEEWNEHQQQQELPKGTSEKMYGVILQKVLQVTEKENKKYKLKALVFRTGKYAAAAAVFLVIAFGIWLSRPPATVQQNKELASTVLPVPQPKVWEVVTNSNHTKKMVQLPDSSIVTLYPEGILKYERGLTGPLRNVYLTGLAYFKVKRNPERPFSVYAGGLKTTALGTSFTINTIAGKQHTSVKLHTGKIVVIPESASSKQGPMYLSKAESELIYNREEQLSRIVKVPAPVKILPEVSLVREGNIITMKNIPLKEVITLLSTAYQVKITAENKDIKNITYTGEVNIDKENIESVLQVICLINNMALSRGAEQEYIIQKNTNTTVK